MVILLQGDHQEFEQLVEFAARHAREIFLVLIGDEISTNDYKRVIRTGGADWVSANADAAEVVEIIAGAEGVCSRHGFEPCAACRWPADHDIVCFECRGGRQHHAGAGNGAAT